MVFWVNIFKKILLMLKVVLVTENTTSPLQPRRCLCTWIFSLVEEIWAEVPASSLLWLQLCSLASSGSPDSGLLCLAALKDFLSQHLSPGCLFSCRFHCSSDFKTFLLLPTLTLAWRCFSEAIFSAIQLLMAQIDFSSSYLLCVKRVF